MTLNGVMALILRYFTEFGSFRGALRQSKAVEDVAVKSSRSLSDLLMRFLSTRVTNSHPYVTLCSDVQVWKDTLSR